MAIVLFYSYSHKDEDLRDELDKHLSLLQRRGLITGWHDRRIGAGGEWRDQIDSHARSADIILLLISADFIASEYCYGVEMKLALERHARGEAIVIPVILRPVDWSDAPFAHLQALPRDAKPLTTWLNRDEGFTNVAQAIRDVVLRRSAEKPGDRISVANANIPKPRMLDAAIPSHIVKDRPTELLVLIRLPDSPGLSGILLDDETAEARPEDVRSRSFNLAFPVGLDGRPGPLKATVKLTAPEFDPPEQAKNLFIPVSADSEVCPFMLTPLRVGRLKILVELQWEDALRGYRRLLTECAAEAATVPLSAAMNVVRIPVGLQSDNATKLSVPATLTPDNNATRVYGAPRSLWSRSERIESEATETAEAAEYEPKLSSPSAARPAPRRAIRKKLLNDTKMVVALIGLVGVLATGYWQFVYMPAHGAAKSVLLAFFVGESGTNKAIENAQVLLQRLTRSDERETDSFGRTLFVVDPEKERELRVSVHATGYHDRSQEIDAPRQDDNYHIYLDSNSAPPTPPVPDPTGKIVTFAVSGSFQEGYAFSSDSQVTIDTKTGLEVSGNITVVGPDNTKEVFIAQPAYNSDSMWQWQNQGSLKGSLDFQEKEHTFRGYSGGPLTHSAYWTPSLGHIISSTDTHLPLPSPETSR